MVAREGDMRPVEHELAREGVRATAGRGSTEDDTNAMCLSIIDEPDAEIAGQGDAFHLY